jgi:hypothetical protein
MSTNTSTENVHGPPRLRVFLAGATGIIGIRLLPLLMADATQAGMTRSTTEIDQLRALGGEPVVCDVFDVALVTKAVTTFQPDAIIHQGCVTEASPTNTISDRFSRTSSSSRRRPSRSPSPDLGTVVSLSTIGLPGRSSPLSSDGSNGPSGGPRTLHYEAVRLEASAATATVSRPPRRLALHRS